MASCTTRNISVIGWKRCEADKRAIFTASAQAQKAADFLLKPVLGSEDDAQQAGTDDESP